MSDRTKEGFRVLVGQIVLGIAARDDVLRIKTGEGEFECRVSADCCSRSWIETIEAPNDLRGAEILDVVDSGACPDAEGFEQSFVRSESGNELKVYSTTIRTTKGDVVIEYRNESNGYYGGSLLPPRRVYA